MSDEQNQNVHRVWISDEEKIISFHQEDGYREKLLSTQEDFISFLLAHGSSGYRFQQKKGAALKWRPLFLNIRFESQPFGTVAIK